MDVDGSDAHEILTIEHDRFGPGVSAPQWSPTGDRLAIGLGAAIYTFAPDGSDFTKVITGGISPYWSPDGSQIAYTMDAQPTGFVGESPTLAIADADGSNVRDFGFAASGPWHPGE
jgi:Tol biopolymer transport system component